MTMCEPLDIEIARHARLRAQRLRRMGFRVAASELDDLAAELEGGSNDFSAPNRGDDFTAASSHDCPAVGGVWPPVVAPSSMIQ
jgi:hypothetical protein